MSRILPDLTQEVSNITYKGFHVNDPQPDVIQSRDPDFVVIQILPNSALQTRDSFLSCRTSTAQLRHLRESCQALLFKEPASARTKGPEQRGQQWSTRIHTECSWKSCAHARHWNVMSVHWSPKSSDTGPVHVLEQCKQGVPSSVRTVKNWVDLLMVASVTRSYRQIFTTLQ